jgi:DNA modification methylase
MTALTYRDFLAAKVAHAPRSGFDIALDDIHPILKPHQKITVQWAIAGGRRAIFAAFGLGKTLMQLETLRVITAKTGGRALIIAPLGVRGEFMKDARLIDVTLTFIRSIEEAGPTGLYITNYETVRDGKLDPNEFEAVSLDEASCLRGFGGSKTFREFMAKIAGDDRAAGVKSEGIRYRFVATATPAPNQYIELLAYAAFLGIMDISGAKTRFFKRNSEKADELTIHVHKEQEFWLWCASWALFVQKPSDLGFSDEGYDLPPMRVHWHELPSDHGTAGAERDGQGRMFANAAIGVQDSAREKRSSLEPRVAKLAEIVAASDDPQPILWCDLNDEQVAIEKALTAQDISFASLYGSQSIDEREDILGEWRDKKRRAFLSKPMMYGAGVNLQQSHTMVFAGIGFKFQDFVQALHRIFRFLQVNACDIHIIYTEAEREVRRVLEDKWARHNELVAQMTAIIREYGLSELAIAATMQRSMGCERQEVSGDSFTMVNNDCVEECAIMADGSVDLILTSIPFSTQYEYSPSFNDFGHTDDNEHFWRQMDFLIPQLHRILEPGRNAVIHVKDRIIPGGMTGLGFQTVYPFHSDCIARFQKHGFAFIGMKTIVTDVVRENNQTYRLGWTEQCKDGSRMGAGMPEYLLLFRKPPTDLSNGYADNPVVKAKRLHGKDGWNVEQGYSRARWQIDAHGFSRSNGNRLLNPEDLVGMDAAAIFKTFRRHTESEVYDFENHVACGEALEAARQLPPSFMLLQPASWHPDVWTDVTRMRTLNGAQYSSGREMHLCPMQFDVADRIIQQFSMEGETVFDPFGGLGTVPLRALAHKRKGIGVELSQSYFKDACWYLHEEEKKQAIPSLFDLMAAE